MKNEYIRTHKNLRLSLDQTHLLWNFEDEPRLTEAVSLGTDTLESFAGLWESGDILAFARLHGILGLCQHGLPVGHTGVFTPCANGQLLPEFDPEGCTYEIDGERHTSYGGFAEPLESWIALSKQVFAMMDLRDQLKRGTALDAATSSLWQDVLWLERRQLKFSDRGESYLFDKEFDLLTAARESGTGIMAAQKFGHRVLENALQTWLDCGGVKLHYEQSKRGTYRLSPSTDLDLGSNLFGPLGIQLDLAMKNPEGGRWELCADCGKRFLQNPKVAPGKDNHCTVCRPPRKKKKKKAALGTSVP